MGLPIGETPIFLPHRNYCPKIGPKSFINYSLNTDRKLDCQIDESQNQL